MELPEPETWQAGYRIDGEFYPPLSSRSARSFSPRNWPMSTLKNVTIRAATMAVTSAPGVAARSPPQEGAANTSMVAAVWLGANRIGSGDMEIGALVAFLLYAMYVAGAVGSMASLFGSYQEAVGAAQRVFDAHGDKGFVFDNQSVHRVFLPGSGSAVSLSRRMLGGRSLRWMHA